MRLLLLVLVVGYSTPVFADEAEDPWAKDVAKDKQDAANKLYGDGNQLFAEQKHAPALEKYKQALALWDHPIIHYNTAVTLIRLERVLDASDHLDKALRYDAKPFTSNEMYRQALDYKILIGKQIGTIEATCTSKEGAILLDGKPWFACAGTRQLKVTAGEHVIVGENKGYATVSRRVVVAGGKTAKEIIDMVRIDALVKFEYPTARWVPWTVAIAGVLVIGAGLGEYALGKNQLDDYKRDFSIACPTGCQEASQPELLEDKQSAELKGTIAASLIIGGSAIVATGLVWAIINRPKRVMPKLEIAPQGGGVRAGIGWSF